LRLLNARVAEHQLNDPNVDAVRQQSARALVTQVMPTDVDSAQMLLIVFDFLRFSA
jgi:hypothetical protein